MIVIMCLLLKHIIAIITILLIIFVMLFLINTLYCLSGCILYCFIVMVQFLTYLKVLKVIKMIISQWVAGFSTILLHINRCLFDVNTGNIIKELARFFVVWQYTVFVVWLYLRINKNESEKLLAIL